jgi:hypothetical protein
MGSQLATCPRLLLSQITYDDDHHMLIFNHRVVPLSPKQYALATALLCQRQKWQETDGQAALCMSIAQLMKATGIGPREILLRHLSNTSMKLMPFGICLVNVRAYGYLILFASEVEETEY